MTTDQISGITRISATLNHASNPNGVTNDVNYSEYVWDQPGDVPVPGDYDGDGRTDIAVFRPATGGLLILKSDTGFTSYVEY